MASVAVIALNWTSVILRYLPEIVKIGQELYSLYCSMRGTQQDKNTVLKSMKLLNKYQDDIDRLLQNPEEKKDLMNGLTVLMRRINENNGNGNSSAGPPGASGCNTTSFADEDCGGSFSSKSSFKGARWMECDVCRGDYNTTNKRPLIFHCGHTFCWPCVERLACRGLIKCPTCRSCETRSLPSIPTNTVLISMLEDLASQGEGKSSYSSDDKGRCDSDSTNSMSYEHQIQFAIFLSKQEAEAQGKTLVEERWQEVVESDRMLAIALQESLVYDASLQCAKCHQPGSASASDKPPKDEKESCAASGRDGAAEDEDASVLLAYKLQQEELAKMKRLCGNESSDWNKEVHRFFGSSLCSLDEDSNNLRREENDMNGRQQDNDEDEATCCRRMENESNDENESTYCRGMENESNDENEATCCRGMENESNDENEATYCRGMNNEHDEQEGVACYRRGDNGEDEVMCCRMDEEEEDEKKSSYSNDEDDMRKRSGGHYNKERLALMKQGEELLIEMAIQLSLNHPQPSDPDDK
ncbi:uncharacterized protein LOC123501221 isoform X1 [Portunus trituberculatus]|nr:uncharacterized protein LOC123501221 isoform X1 [Portunus trituberculatus]XP_045105854.1 uncharacterized protein LOC123501221 isoform X1 [Portunus trituberculatus]XP_045105855.1 uncharacterized protein LOC123501221 isoform X1 [Portunus trituberculatus]